MRRFVTGMVICALSAATAACGARVAAPTKPPLPGDASSQRTNTERPQPKLIAPPPAYGNKIVVVPNICEPAT